MKFIYVTILTFVFAGNITSQTDSVVIPKKETPQVLNNVSNPVPPIGTPKYLPFNFGPRIGVALTQLSNDDFYGRQFKPVINAGGFFNYQINNYFSVGTEVYFTQHAKNYNYTTTSNLFPKLLSNLGLFGVDPTIVDLISTGLNSGFFNINDTIYTLTKGTVKISTLEVPLMASFHYKNFKFTGGAYAAFHLSSSVSEEMRDKSALLDLLAPSIDTLINNTIGGGIPGFDIGGLVIDQAASNYRKAHTSGSGSVTGLANVMFGYIGEISYTFSNNVNLGIRINYPWMTFKPNQNVSYVRNTQYSASLSYLFRIKKKSKGLKAFATH